MRLILYDMNTLPLISTVTPSNSRVVIEHEIISIKKKIIFGIWYMIKNTSITIHIVDTISLPINNTIELLSSKKVKSRSKIEATSTISTFAYFVKRSLI